MSYTKYVRAKEQAVIHFRGNIGGVTLGRIYTFPNITLDNGIILNLCDDESSWVNEFEFLNIVYEIY